MLNIIFSADITKCQFGQDRYTDSGPNTVNCKGLITLCVDPLAFLLFSRFSRVFSRVFDTNMLVSKTREKTRDKREKNARKIKNASPTRDNVSLLHYALGKNASQLRFGRVLVAFWSRFGRVLVTSIAKTQTQRIV